MGDYLKLFKNHNAYEEYKESGLVMPIISHCIKEIETHNSQYHEYVEIGGIKWATMNVGANSVTDKGLYFQWGDTQGYTASQVGNDKNFTWGEYKFWTADDGSGSSGLTKYNDEDGKIVLESSDDAVTAAWGDGWRMPTSEEFRALGRAVTTAWTNDYQGSGVAGLICTDKTDSNKVLFFSAGGHCDSSSIVWDDSSGIYHSNTLDIRLPVELSIQSYGTFWNNVAIPRYDGCLVRGVFIG